METKPRRHWKAALAASLTLGAVAVLAWAVVGKTDLLRHRDRITGLTTLDPGRADSAKTDSINALPPSAPAMFDPLDSLMATFPGSILQMDSLAMPMAGLSDDIQIETKPDRLIIELGIPNLNEASLQIDAERQSLKVSGEQQTMQEEKDAAGQVVSRSESSASYSTSFSLPEPVKPDGLKSHYEDGRLHIEIPRVYRET